MFYAYRCNLKLRIYPESVSIPVVFHNLKGYDAHHIISTIGLTTTDIETYTDPKGRERVSFHSACASSTACLLFDYVPWYL